MQLTDPERKRLLENLTDEMNGAALYDSLAVAEKDDRLAEVYRRLATVEHRHAERWRPYRSVATWYLWRSLDP